MKTKQLFTLSRLWQFLFLFFSPFFLQAQIVGDVDECGESDCQCELTITIENNTVDPVYNLFQFVDDGPCNLFLNVDANSTESFTFSVDANEIGVSNPYWGYILSSWLNNPDLNVTVQTAAPCVIVNTVSSQFIEVRPYNIECGEEEHEFTGSSGCNDNNLAYFEYTELDDCRVLFTSPNPYPDMHHYWDFGDGNGMNYYPPGSAWFVEYPEGGTYHINHTHAESQCQSDITLDCGDSSPCSEEIFSIATFCDFNDLEPCDPCSGTLSDGALQLCVVNQDNQRFYDLNLPAAVTGWTINTIDQVGNACIAIQNFDPSQTYEVCATITFWLPDGSTCVEEVCTTIGGCGDNRRTFNIGYSSLTSNSKNTQSNTVFKSQCNDGDAGYFEWELLDDCQVLFTSPYAVTDPPIYHWWDFGDGNGANLYPPGTSWTVTYPESGSYDVCHQHADFTCCETITIDCEPSCTDQQFSIATFCNFTDPDPCDPCTGTISGGALQLCVVNQDNQRIYELGLPAAVTGWTVNNVNAGSGACIAIQNFDPAQTYEVCTTIIFWQSDGSTCEEEVCTTIGNCFMGEDDEANRRNSKYDSKHLEHHLIDIFPNPTNNYLNVVNSFDEQINVQLISVDGQSISIATIAAGDRELINVQNLPNGVYSLQILSQEKVQLHSEKIVIHH